MAFWICLCAFLSCAGWVLSAFRVLSLTGYLFVLALGGALWCAWRIRSGTTVFPRINFSKQRRRFRRPFPLAFLLLFVLATLGGVLNPPSNYDALAYREPRMLHWLAEGQWHWIQTDFARLNTRACGYEWVATPLIALTKTDRLLFLINAISFSLLPGLMFSVFTRVGVKRRVAWRWMWLTPTGYCFLLQVGGIANDMFSAVFALAAVDYALRARAENKLSNLWLSVLAIGLCTGGKSSNTLLGLPWLAVVWPALPRLRFRPVASLGVLLIGLGASLLPMMVINQRYCGDWTGLVLEFSPKGQPLVKLANNVWLGTIQNFVPPIFPIAPQWNQRVLAAMPAGLQAKLEENFEPAGAHWSLPEMESEEFCGLGMGVSLCLVVSTLLAWCWRNRASPGGWGVFESRLQRNLFFAALYASLVAFMLKSGLSNFARLLTPYYALLFLPWLVLPAHALVVRKKWWPRFGILIFLVAGFLLVISPGRPLWPARYVLGKLNAQNPSSKLVSRAYTVYTVQGRRADSFAPARAALPPDAKVLGLVTYDDPEAALWRPFGSRRILHVTKQDTPESLERRGIRYVLVTPENFSIRFGQNFEEWLARVNGEVLQTVPLQLRASGGPMNWWLVKLREP